MKTKEARRFYSSRVWADTRRAYRDSVGGLCEECMKKGIIKPGEIVHHKIHIDYATINDPNVLLSWDNLEYVCRDCHAKLHNGKRWYVEANGSVRINEV